MEQRYHEQHELRQTGSMRSHDSRLGEDIIYTTEWEEHSLSATHHCGERFVCRRDDTSVVAWSIVLSVLLLYVGTIFLYRFAFIEFHIGPTGIEPLGEDDLGWTVWNHIVDGLFWFDLIFNFFLAYEDRKGHEVIEVISMWLIAKQYLSCMFWVNLLACLPEALIGQILQLIIAKDSPVTDLGVTRVVRMQRISRLARLSRLTRLTKLAAFNLKIPGWDRFKRHRGVRVMNFVMVLIFACHLFACGWYLTAALHDLSHHGDVKNTWVGKRTVTVSGEDGCEERTLLNQGPLEQWLVAMYFVLTVFTTVGFGDISANTEGEIFFVGLTMFVGAVIHGIIISEVIGVVTSTDRDHEFQQRQLQVLDAFALHVDLTPELFRSIRADVQALAREWRINQTFDKEEMKALLLSKYMPRQIIGKLPESLFGGQLSQNMFLQCCSAVQPIPPTLPSLMAMHLLPTEFSSGEVVFQQHDFAFNLSLVLQGVFAYVGLPTPQGGLDAMKSISIIEQPEEPGVSRSPITPISVVQNILTGRTTSNLSSLVQRGFIQTPASDEPSEQKLYPYRLFGPKTYFGDMECISGSARLGTMRCERAGPNGSASVLVLRKRDLVELVQEFPQFGDIWATAAHRRESLRRMALRRLKHPRSCRHLAAATIQRAFHLRKKRMADPSSRAANRKEALMESSTAAGSRGSATFSATSHQSTQQSHTCIKNEVAKLNRLMWHLQAEMVAQRNATSEVKELLRAVLNT